MTPIDRAAIAIIRRDSEDLGQPALSVFAIWLGLFGLVATIGCTTLSKATRHADKAMAVVDVVANNGARLYQEATLAAVNLCRAELGETSTPESREACLRRKGFAPDQVEKVRESYEALARAYDEIADALEQLREAQPILEQADDAVEGVMR